MNITMNSAPLPSGSEATVAANGATAVPADALALDPAQAAAPGVPAAMPFLQFMDLNAATLTAKPALPELAAADAPVPQDGSVPAPIVAEAAEETPAAGNDTLLAAMAMPLMPSMMMAVPAALPAGLRFASSKPEQAASNASVGAAAVATATTSTTTAGAIELPLAAAATPVARATDAALPAQAIDTASAQLARAGLTQAQPASVPAPAPAVAGASPAAPSAAQAQPREAAAPDAAAAPMEGSAGFGVAAPAAASAPVRDGGTLTLAGPPTAWRQSLQEALGDRLNLQLTKNAEQAVIRLEPPMLGRVEISIRHSAGALEVNITATHGEVLRQLGAVSENLRSDLAGRQYTDVSVNVSQATPRAQAAAQAGSGFGAGSGADAQGRSQKGEDQDERAPGAALAEAHYSTTAFSLSPRA